MAGVFVSKRSVDQPAVDDDDEAGAIIGASDEDEAGAIGAASDDDEDDGAIGAAEDDDTAELDEAVFTGVVVGVPRLKIQMRPMITITATMMIIQVLRFMGLTLC